MSSKPPEFDESDLIRASMAGDRAAFERLVRLKRRLVVRTALQITGDTEDALDVAQAVFLKLWQGLDRFDPGRRFDTWVYRVTVNAAIDMIRSRGPKELVRPLADDAVERLAAPDAGAERRLDRGRLRQAFLRLAGGLAPRQRAAFVLREIEGLETAEVAEVLGVTDSTVRNHLFQARRLLRRGLERDYPELVRRFLAPGDGDGEPAGSEGGDS